MILKSSRRNTKARALEGHLSTERDPHYRAKQEEQDTRNEADWNFREEAGKRIARQQADHDARDPANRRRKSKAVQRGHDLVKQHAEQQEAEKNRTPQEPAFAQPIQGQLQVLRDQYYFTPEGPAKVLAARAYLDRLAAPRSLEQTNAYRTWLNTLEIYEMAAISKSSRDTKSTIRDGGSGPVMPRAEKPASPVTPTVKATPPQLASVTLEGAKSHVSTTMTTSSAKPKTFTLAPASSTPTKAPRKLPTSFFTSSPPTKTRIASQPILHLSPESQKPLSPTAKFSFPSTIDRQLAHALAEGDVLEPDVQRAIKESLKTLRSEAEKSLRVRAASMKLTSDEWAQSQNYADAAAYIEAQVSGARHDTEPSPEPAHMPPTPDKPWDEYLERYKAQMKKAVKEGIENRALRKGFRNGEAFAKGKGYESVEAWAARKVERMKIKADMIPSKKHVSDMVDFERMIEDLVWKDWQEKLVKAANWHDKIAALPSAPDFSPVQMGTGKLMGTKWAVV